MEVVEDVYELSTRDGLINAPRNPFFHRLEFSWYNMMKLVIGTFTIAPVRLFGMAICLLCSWTLATIATIGKDQKLESQPTKGWRKTVLWFIAKIITRVFFFIGGFYWINVKGVQASPKDAPILVVAPHSSCFDVIALALTGAPSIVVKSSTRQVPVIGKLLDLVQAIYVEREETKSRHEAIDKIKNRTNDGKNWPQIFIFPEGTCSNRSCLISFKAGAFLPGTPVQPVIIRFPNKFDTITWTWDGLQTYLGLWWTLVQFVNYCEVEFLPVYTPNSKEKSDANLFARNVRETMAQALAVPVMDYTYQDGLNIKATNPNLRHNLKRISYFRKQLNISISTEFGILKSIAHDEKLLPFTIQDFAMSLNMGSKPDVVADFLKMLHISDGKMDIQKYIVFSFVVSTEVQINRFIPAIFLLYSEGRKYMSRIEFMQFLQCIFNTSARVAEDLFGVHASSGNYLHLTTFKLLVQKQFEYMRLCALDAKGLIGEYPPRSIKHN